MATGTFGHTDTVNYSRWGGSATYACVGLRATMPEDGTVLKIALRLAAYPDATPIVWGAIWNRNTRNLLVSSSSSRSPNNNFSNLSSLQLYEFNLPETKITGGTPIWIGYAKNSADAGRGLYFASNSNKSGQTTDYYNVSRSTPGHFSSTSGSWTSEALWVEVTYKTGGQVKVWSGSAWLEKPAKVWNGSSWVEKPVKTRQGSEWKESN